MAGEDNTQAQEYTPPGHTARAPIARGVAPPAAGEAAVKREADARASSGGLKRTEVPAGVRGNEIVNATGIDGSKFHASGNEGYKADGQPVASPKRAAPPAQSRPLPLHHFEPEAKEPAAELPKKPKAATAQKVAAKPGKPYHPDVDNVFISIQNGENNQPAYVRREVKFSNGDSMSTVTRAGEDTPMMATFLTRDGQQYPVMNEADLKNPANFIGQHASSPLPQPQPLNGNGVDPALVAQGQAPTAPVADNNKRAALAPQKPN